MKRTLGCMALCGWLMASGSLQAHHSLAGVYDMKAEKEVAGTVEKVQFSNPLLPERAYCEVDETKDISSQIRH